MRILFVVLLISVAALLWAAVAMARHIQRHRAERLKISATSHELLDHDSAEHSLRGSAIKRAETE
jgi:hypothetical protein